MTLTELQQKVADTWRLLDIDQQRRDILILEAEMNQPEFWQRHDHATKVSQDLKALQAEVQSWESLTHDVADAVELQQLLVNEPDANLEAELKRKTNELLTRFEQLEFAVLLDGEHDQADAIVSIHAGAGGVDAQDWAEMLERMILRFAEQQGWRTTLVDRSAGSEAGLKSATIMVRGRYAYGYLQSEHGTHRLVRISPFDAEGMRHTSFASIEVIPDFGDAPDVELDPNDLRIDVFRSGGNGGQSVNTTDSAVRIVHIPTGITVSCQNEKSQHQNKAAALAIIKSRLLQQQLAEKRQKEQEVKGEYKSAEWGNQIRSYVLHPYKLVKDHRTDYEETNPDSVLDGKLLGCVDAYLRWKRS